jgi:hypothetical protein
MLTSNSHVMVCSYQLFYKHTRLITHKKVKQKDTGKKG